MKIVIAITGASGSIYAEDLIERLMQSEAQIERIAIVRSKNAEMVWEHELETAWPQHQKIQYFEKDNFLAPFASGSANWDAMVILPASMGSIARIAHGISAELISRTADVMLKEEKQLIICPREMPFNQIHLKNILQLQQAGATIFPTSPSFYSKPTSIKELIGTVTSRIVDHLGINQKNNFRWGEEL